MPSEIPNVNLLIKIPTSDVNENNFENEEDDNTGSVAEKLEKPQIEFNLENSPICQTSKEMDCWNTYQKMTKKGINVSYDTILR